MPAKMKTMMAALKSTMGNISASCEKAGIARITHYDWLEKFPEYKQYYEELPELVGDFVEGSIMKQIQEGNPTMTIFYAKTKLKHRGYVERQEVKHEGLEAPKVIIQLSDAQDQTTSKTE